MKSRPFGGDEDLERMAGLPTAPFSHRLHRGDLTWRLRFLLADEPPADIVRLWEDGDLAGFALIYPRYAAFDVAVRAGVRGSALEAEIVDWAIAATRRLRHRKGLDTDVHERDTARIDLLYSRGFRPRPRWVALRRDLGEPLPVALPTGYTLRLLTGDDVEQRAAAASAAFGGVSSAECYRRFMRTPSYRDGADLMVEAPDGSVAAFCIAWGDGASGAGLLEPIGTHPDQQRRGLGRALLHGAFNALAGRGMREVMVLAEEGGAAERFYRSAGMWPSHRVLSCVRDD